MRTTRGHRFGAVGGFAAIWILVAVLVDHTTFHLAPVIVAAAGGIGAQRRPWAGAALSTVVALLVGAGLAAIGRLDGPSLLPWGGAPLETGLAAIGGGVLGVIATRLTRPAAATN